MMLAAVAGGVRDLLLARGEPVADLVLRASVPVSLHQEPSGRPRGSQAEPARLQASGHLRG